VNADASGAPPIPKRSKIHLYIYIVLERLMAATFRCVSVTARVYPRVFNFETFDSCPLPNIQLFSTAYNQNRGERGDVLRSINATRLDNIGSSSSAAKLLIWQNNERNSVEHTHKFVIINLLAPELLFF